MNAREPKPDQPQQQPASARQEACDMRMSQGFESIGSIAARLVAKVKRDAGER